ncbi:MAG: hypothetical protein J6W82_09550 [Bacteroidales bacterium]|nr:hypothetical protein [Bacteroidales bacterium]
MKKFFSIVICLMLAIPSFADGLQYLAHCKSLYNSGRYEEAKQGFTLCKVYDDIDDVEMDGWIAKCESAITARKNKAAAAARKAAAERQAAFEESQRQREMRNLVFISTNARTLTANYSNMQSAIKGNLKSFEFAKKEDDAKWGIYVTANAREYNNPNGLYIAYVDGIAQVIDLVNGVIVFEQEYSQKGGHANNYSEAVKVAYNKVINEISQDLLEAIVLDK